MFKYATVFNLIGCKWYIIKATYVAIFCATGTNVPIAIYIIIAVSIAIAIYIAIYVPTTITIAIQL